MLSRLVGSFVAIAPQDDTSVMKHIYFDHSASTPVDKPVFEAMLPYFTTIYGNPSSIHKFGQDALAGVDNAREQLAGFFNAKPEEIIFTSGATEANNLAIKGAVSALRRQGVKKIHLITSKVEHDAVLEPFEQLEKTGVETTFIDVNKRGIVDVEKLKAATKPHTALVSVMYVNSEVGSVQPVRAIGKHIRKLNDSRMREWEKRRPQERGGKPRPIIFHTDATQAVNFFNCDVDWNYIDLLSMSSHKIYGPKGAGALYVRSGIPVDAIQHGGHHERNLRSGTLNVPGIVGLGAAVAQLGRGEKGEPSRQQTGQNEKISQLRDMLVEGILKNIPETMLNTEREHATPAHAHFTLLGCEGESMLLSLDLEGIAVSTGSACASGSLKASHVLLAMGIKEEVAHNSIRFSLGKHNTEAEVKRVIAVLPPIIERLRKMNPLYDHRML